ncbi:rhodanese-like domain-containing protein [Bradyrhizobium sp. AZCC 2289]|uniref:rhodanese-like domain-containing protein n=1 Tax=Bradyrhizobium sp. AZCC 2289 TaxID=3117026 RepID=UPI002FEFBAAC
MSELRVLIEQYGLLVVFAAAFLSRMGLPVPAFPVLLTAAAMTAGSARAVGGLALAGVAGGLIADIGWFAASRRYGRSLLRFLCKISVSPDSCVRQTESVYARLGGLSLVVGKIMPGIGLISTALAGIADMSIVRFVALNCIGESLFIGLTVLLGVLFNSAILTFIETLAHLGAMGIALILGALAIYVVGRWWKRRLFIRELRMARITATELAEMIDRGETPVIIDVRPVDLRREDGVIPGAVFAHPADGTTSLAGFSGDLEVIVYCDCPKEASAVAAVRHLRQAGFHRIRPLLGGMDAWIAAGRAIARPEILPKSAGEAVLRERRAS